MLPSMLCRHGVMQTCCNLLNHTSVVQGALHAALSQLQQAQSWQGMTCRFFSRIPSDHVLLP